MKRFILPVLLFFSTIFIAFGLQDSIPSHKKTDISDLHSWIDSLVGMEMSEYPIPGAIIAIVQDSHQVYYQGYGFADVKNGCRVDPDLTGFRIASVTKTFTATATMQLVEQGLLDLNVPVSEYLPDDDFTFLDGEPFTMHHLLTHTAGFDFTDISDAARTPDKVVPLEDIARYHMPDQVHAPGTVHSYSNFGYALAGYLIEVISGESYEEYIRKQILAPLNMNMSSMSQPLKKPHSDHLSKSYRWDGRHIELARDYTNTVPGGGLIANARDMSRYMRLHLNGGILDTVRLLSSESHRILTSQQYGSEDTKYGICYSFLENGWTGRRNLEHTGGQLGFLTLMILIPETGTGLFISHNNRKNAEGFRYDLARAILDTMLHRKERNLELPQPSEEFISEAPNYTGTYRQLNYPHSSFEKLGTLFGFTNYTYRVKNDMNGMLRLAEVDFVKMNQRVFHENNKESAWNISFQLDDQGVARRLDAGTLSYERISWYQEILLIQIVMGLSFLILLFNFFKRPLIWLLNRCQNDEKEIGVNSSLSEWLYWTGALFVLGFIGIMINLAIFQDQLADYGVPLSFKFPLLLNTIGGVAAFYSPLALWQVWKSDLVKSDFRIWHTLLITSLIVITLGFWHYNVIGFWY